MATNTQYIPITLPLGNSRSIRINAFRTDCVTPLNLTGAAVVMTVRETASSTDPEFSIANEIGGGDQYQITMVNSSMGQFQINIRPVDTMTCDSGLYTWAVEAYWLPEGALSPDRRYTIAYGPFTMTEHA